MSQDGVVIVTGAFGGIGTAVVEQVSSDGYTVLACDRVGPPADWPSTRDERASAIQLDLTLPEAPAVLVKAARATGLPLRGLVNAHGMQFREPVGTFPDNMFNLVVDVNLAATFRLIRGILPLLAAPGGRVINFSSLYAVLPAQDQVAYAAAKAGIEGLTRAVAVELAPQGITVNAIAPGLIWHDGLAGVWPDKLFDDLRKRVPMGRAGTAHEVAQLVAYLLSAGSGYLTGQVLRLDGGASSGQIAPG